MNEKALMEKKNNLITRAEEVLNTAKAQNRELTEAEAEELAEIRDNVRRIIKSLGIKRDFEELEDRKPDEVKEEKTEDEKEKEVEAAETRAFENYIRGYAVSNERAANMTLTDNGAVIPKTIANKIIRKVYDISPILQRSSKYNVKGTLSIPYYDESTNAITMAWATEFQELESNVGKLQSIDLTGYLAGALALVSRSLINNAAFDIVAHVIDIMAYNISRFIEGVLLNGSGSVEGLSTLTNKLVADSATAITADDVVKLQGKVKDVYQNDAIWIMNENTRLALRLLKDEMGRYLLQDDISAPFGRTLLGKPVYVSDNADEIGAGATPIYYGDMRGLATKFSEVLNIEVLREKYATQHAVGVVGWVEFDSKVENAQMIAKLEMAGATPSA